MRMAVVSLAVLSAVAGAWADPADLTGGVLIAHHIPDIYYTVAPPSGWCGLYASYAISHPSQAVTQLSPGRQSWYVLAAWESEAKTWCGTEFGFGSFNPDPFVFYEWMACFPVSGLEIPTANWPGPNEGTAFVTTGTPWSGNWMPVYWFAGYAYDYIHGATIIGIDVDPLTGFCGFSNCLNPPGTFAVHEPDCGGMGVNMPGYTPVWPAIETWACCLTLEPYCRMLEERECLLQGGIWLGPEWTCEPNPCEHPGACCVVGNCSVVYAESCALVGGTFLGPDTLCEPNPCPAACCFEVPPAPQECEIMFEDDCIAAYGFWHPEWGSCDPNPCTPYTPAAKVTWGRIKDLYR